MPPPRGARRVRALDFTLGIVTGGGTEFVRRLSKRFYGVQPGMIVGTLIGYRFGRDAHGRPVVRRTIGQVGSANDGGAKLEHIHAQVGRAPVLAVGNSGGDREMLEWAQASPHGGLAVLIDHDDGDGEYADASQAVTFAKDEPITAVAAQLGRVVGSIRRDWKTVFAAPREAVAQRSEVVSKLSWRARATAASRRSTSSTGDARRPHPANSGA